MESSVARTLRLLEQRFERGALVAEAVLTVSEPDETGTAAGMSDESPKTTESDSGPEGVKDVQSDPAKGSDGRSDWSDEGGATETGPSRRGRSDAGAMTY